MKSLTLSYQEPPLSTADHRPCDLAVLPVPLEPAAGRENAVGARHCRALRNDTAMEPQFRTALRVQSA